MKKKVLGGLAAVAIAAVAAFNININENNDLSSISLANVEALAQNESGIGTPCGGPKTYGTCQSTNTVNCKDTSGCQ